MATPISTYRDKPRPSGRPDSTTSYLAVFSLLGQPGGYSYISGNALTPIRQLIMEPLKDSAIGAYVTKVPDDVSLKDIMLISEPLSCWMLKVSDHLVFLPLSGDSRTSQPLRELQRLGGGHSLELAGHASWPFSTFRAFGTVPVHLAGADAARSLVGLSIRGTLTNKRPLKGICISHSGESATLLCPIPEIRAAGMDLA